MLFSDFLKNLVQAAIDAKHLMVLQSEEHRKTHYQENDKGHLEHKTTTRIHNGKEKEIPEKSVHNVDDFLVKGVQLETETNVYLDDGEIKTHVKKGLFTHGVLVKVKMKLSAAEAPEGIHAQIDDLNDKLKEHLE